MQFNQIENIELIQKKILDYSDSEFIQSLISRKLLHITHWELTHKIEDKDVMPYIPEVYGIKNKKTKKITDKFVSLGKNNDYCTNGFNENKLEIIFQPLSVEFRSNVFCYEYLDGKIDRLVIEYANYQLKNNQLIFNKSSITELRVIRRCYWYDSVTLIAVSVGIFSDPMCEIFYFNNGKLKLIKRINYDANLAKINEIDYNVNSDKDFDHLFVSDFEEEKEHFAMIFSALTHEQLIEINQSIEKDSFDNVEQFFKSRIEPLEYDEQLEFLDTLNGVLDDENEGFLPILRETFGINFTDTDAFESFLIVLINYVHDILEN